LADGEDWVEGRRRVLEDHRDALTPHLPQLVPSHLEDILPLEVDFATRDAGWRHGQDAQDGLHRRRFAAAGLANQADLLPAVHGEIHPVQDFEGASVDVEMNVQILDLQ
jgi:hypothetical protein